MTHDDSKNTDDGDPTDDGCELKSLGDVMKAFLRLQEALETGHVVGEVAERVLARVLRGDRRLRGIGRDFVVPASVNATNEKRLRLEKAGAGGVLECLGPGGIRTPYELFCRDLTAAQRARFAAWLSAPGSWVECKARVLDPRDEDQWLDTRGGGPDTPFFPFADSYGFVLFDRDGGIKMARLLPHSDLIDFVGSRCGRGGSWNYKCAISPWMEAGRDITDLARLKLQGPI